MWAGSMRVQAGKADAKLNMWYSIFDSWELTHAHKQSRNAEVAQQNSFQLVIRLFSVIP